MKCHSCLKTSRLDLCPRCRKTLFGARKGGTIIQQALPSPTGNSSGAPRKLSMSGAQPKYAMKLEGRDLVFCDSGSSYMLKAGGNVKLRFFQDIPANEQLTMLIARKVFKIRTAECSLAYLPDGSPAYLTKRFDVLPDGQKIDQEDFSQLIERSNELEEDEFKYSVSYEEVAEKLKDLVPSAPPSLEEFFKQVLFCYLVGNGDAHIKNFSLHEDPASGTIRLTPAYDMLCTVLHLPDGERLALELFKDHETEAFKDHAFYSYQDFLVFGKMIGIKESRVVKALADIVSHEPEIQELVTASFLSEEGKTIYMGTVRDRTGALLLGR